MLTSCALASGIYVITRTTSYLCTRPEEENSFLGGFRKSFANVAEKVEKSLGERAWGYFSHVVWDNLFVSVFAVSLLFSSVNTSNTPMSLIENTPMSLIEKVGNGTVFGLGVCTISWMSRWGLYKCLSSSPTTSPLGALLVPKM